MTGLGIAPWRPEREVLCIRLLALLSTLTVFGWPAHTTKKPSDHHRLTGLTARARKPSEACSNSDPRPCIVQAAERYGQSVDDAEDVAWCESRDEPDADNGQGDYGLYQFAPGTFAATVWGHGHPERIWSARYSALAAMWAWAQQPSWKDQWQCQ